MTRIICRRSSSSKAKRRRAIWAVAMDSGPWICSMAQVRSWSRRSRRHSAGNGSTSSPARFNASAIQSASSQVESPALSDCG